VTDDALPPERGNPDTTIAGVRFRELGPGDATALLALKRQLDRETSFMLLEPDERTETAQDVAADLQRLAGSNSVVIVADSPAGVVGYVEARGGEFRRNRTTAHVVIGVLATASGQGVGSGLLRAVERWALTHGIHRLELTVMAHNERAARLYERMGFEVEGRRRECLTVDGKLADELYMGKLLPAAAG
jgi:RimJ/RimL family protein N-acetyltransferase